MARPHTHPPNGSGGPRDGQLSLKGVGHPGGAVDEPRVESLNMRHRRELTEQEQRFKLELARAGRARLDTPTVTHAEVDRRIAQALDAERSVVVPALRAAVDELLEAEREHVKSQ